LKLKFAVSVICLLLFVAAVDTIPDPPAINPPSSHSCGISALHIRGPFTLLEKEWFLASNSPRHIQVMLFSLQLAVENIPAGVSSAPFIHLAADTSPPVAS
jgi:hypothetical protein